MTWFLRVQRRGVAGSLHGAEPARGRGMRGAYRAVVLAVTACIWGSIVVK